MERPEYPTYWQRKTIWRALTGLALAAIFTIAVGGLYLFARVLAFLQPILVPFAIAGVLAYLLEPLVVRIMQSGKRYTAGRPPAPWTRFVQFITTRTSAVWSVFIVTTVALVGFLIWIIPVISTQTARLAKKVPEITYQVRVNVATFGRKVRDSYGLRLLPDEFLEIPTRPAKLGTEPRPNSVTPAPAPATPIVVTPPPVPATPPVITPAPAPPKLGDPSTTAVPPTATTPPSTTATTAAPVTPAETPEEMLHKLGSGDWVNDALPSVVQNVWKFFSASLGGFLGFFGFLLSLIIVPLYLFYLLTEFPSIARGWSQYLPLRASAFKDEVVDCLEEINGYLIAFFRGQLVVSIINGAATGLLLAIVGLDFGGLIGFALCFLGIIPYVGIVLCWIPAVIIASVQGGSWVVTPGADWWVFPLIVTGAFAIVQQVDALFVTPKIVGERVGLHPLTVIFSVFLWSLLLGGLLGAILAVPLTATLKVILKRYVWERKIMADPLTAGPIPISDK
jgi:predicted PurR-regulated permease PerM